MNDLGWQFRETPPDGGIAGGGAAQFAFSEQSIDTLVREVIQNSKDQDINEGPVKVKFEFIDLSGKEREAFEKAIDWSDLHTHLLAVADLNFTAAHRFKRELGELDSLPGIRLLRITDSGTKGLTGPEYSRFDEPEGNFASLCRNILTNQKSSGGGSFGLGKTVLWSFSGIGTVLFFSDLNEPEGGNTRRLFGRANYPYHVTESDNENQAWEGPGWFGQFNEDNIAESKWDASDELLRDLQIFRDPNIGSGTTALVLDFDELDREEDRSLQEIASSLYKAVERYYWPSLLQGTLEVEISVTEHGNVEYKEIIDNAWVPSPNVQPFVEAWQKSSENCIDKFTGDINEVVSTKISVEVPERHGHYGVDPAPASKVDATLRLVSFPLLEETKELANTIAMVRGAGMVVEYKYFSSPLDLDYAVCGVFVAGLTGRGFGHGGHDQTVLNKAEKEQHDRVEQFLRASEPPAHDKWDHRQARCMAEFPSLAARGLERLRGSIKSALSAAVYMEPPSGGITPEGLGRLLKFGTQGTVHHEGKLTCSVRESKFEDGRWLIRGQISNTKPEHGWRAKLSVGIQEDGSKKGEILPLHEVIIDGLKVSTSAVGAIFDTKEERVDFELETAESTEYGAFLNKCRIWIDVTKQAPEGGGNG